MVLDSLLCTCHDENNRYCLALRCTVCVKKYKSPLPLYLMFFRFFSFSLLRFPEGTDLNPISKASSDKYAEKKSLPQTHYTMYPKVRGFSQAVALLSDTETKGKGIDAVYNVTMAYDDFAKVIINTA